MSQILASPRITHSKTPAERREGALIRQMFLLLSVMGFSGGIFGWGIWQLADSASVRVTVANQEAFVAKPRGGAARASMQIAEAGR